jgi:hypothetical protein
MTLICFCLFFAIYHFLMNISPFVITTMVYPSGSDRNFFDLPACFVALVSFNAISFTPVASTLFCQSLAVLWRSLSLTLLLLLAPHSFLSITSALYFSIIRFHGQMTSVQFSDHLFHRSRTATTSELTPAESRQTSLVIIAIGYPFRFIRFNLD